MKRNIRRAAAVAVAMTTAVAVSACTDNRADSDDPRHISVTSSADECVLSTTDVPSGHLTFSVKNTGNQVTEFYLLADDGLRIIGEVENIGPGLTRELVATAGPGSYITACKPGMKGEGIRADFAVSDSGEDLTVKGDDAQLVAEASARYRTYVRDQSAQLLDKTTRFAALYIAGKDDEARALYPVARVHWERIETVAESFGDLDPRMDAREADLEPGEEWTGWHAIEKDLWPQRAKGYAPLTKAQRTKLARQLVADTRTLNTRLQPMEFSAVEIANGSRGLLEEVATGKVTGEEEYWSRTDLYDFQANVDGARIAFEGVEPLVARKDPRLAKEIATRFAALQTLLDQHRDGKGGFVGYDTLTQPQIKDLARAVDALSEPLSGLTAVVVAS